MKFYIEVDFGDRVKGDEAAMKVTKHLMGMMKELRPEQIHIESDLDRRFNEELRSIGAQDRGSGSRQKKTG